MTILPRAATAPELAKIRSDNQSSRLYMTVHLPATVYSARLAAVPTSNDNVTSVTYDTGSGTYTDILVDQTMYVGTSAGAYDLGMVRIRSLTGLGATSGTFTIGCTSEIDWQATCYLTVVDEFALWPRKPEMSSGTVYMDTDVAYSDQHSKCLSFPIFPRYAVKWLTGATVTVTRDGSQSWSLNNTINSYAWTAPGSASISGDTTNTATITYNAASPTVGYRVGLTIGNSDSVSFTGYGRVFVLANESDAIEVQVSEVTGSYQSGGWSAQVTCYSGAERSAIRDRALCILHRRDWYGLTSSDEGSIGYVANDENIEMIGWIAGETIKWATEDKASAVTFTVQGPQWWLNQMTMPTVGLKNSTTTPTNWKKFQGLTAKSATWHILMWRTTAPRMMDCFSIENGWAALQLQSGGAQTVWQQIANILNDFLIAKPCCDSYARMFMQIEQNCLSTTDRSSIPSVMTVTTADWMNEIDFDRRVVNDIAAVDISGDVFTAPTFTSLYALSPGRTFAARGGRIFTRSNLTVYDQAGLNALAAAIWGWQNNPYPNWRFQFPSNLHLIDLAPYQYLTISIASGNTPRAFTASNLRLIPREIRRRYQNGYVTCEVTIEAETSIGLGIIGDTPAEAPGIPTTPPPVPVPTPIPIPTPSGNATEVWFCTSNAIYWSSDYFAGGQPTWTKIGSLPITPTWFGIAKNGTTAYICTSGSAAKIYATATPKTPSWSIIAEVGTSILSTTINSYFNYVMGPFTVQGTTLYGAAHMLAPAGACAYGSYNGTAWSWSQMTTLGSFGPGGVGKDTYADANNHTVRAGGTNTLLETIGGSPSTSSPGYRFYRSTAGTRYVFWRTTGNVLNLHTVGGADINLGTSNFDTNITDSNVFGSETGAQIYVVSAATAAFGHLWLSDNGSTFTDIATWNAGWVRDATESGGGSLVWIPKDVTSSNVPTRLYNRDGSVLRDMTGNFWSLTTGNQTMVGMGLVY